MFATGLPKVGDAWRLSGAPVLTAGYTALGRLAYRDLAVPAPGSLRPGQTPNQSRADAMLRVAILDGVSESARADLFDWVERTAQAQSNYGKASRPGRRCSASSRSRIGRASVTAAACLAAASR